MTDLQKEQIKTLRLQGIGYVKIGEMLGISDNTVRSFCRRNGLGDAAKNTVACKHCGKLIKIIPKQKPRKFCSDACRTAWIGKLFMPTPAPTAVSLSPHTGIKSVNIAVTTATFLTASERSVKPVTDDYRARLERYLASMIQAKRMLSMGILTPEDYAIIDTMQGEKFGISLCSLYRGIDLIYSGFRGNMSHYEEVTKCQEQ